MEILSNIYENLTLELFNLNAFLISQIYVNDVFIPGLFSNVDRDVRLRSVLNLSLLKTFIVLGLSVLRFDFFYVSFAVSLGLILDEPWLFIFSHGLLETFFVN